MTLLERLAGATSLLASALDIVAERAFDATPPAWCSSRGWSTFLLGLDDEVVTRCDRQGAASVLATLPGAPIDLAELARCALRASEIERFAGRSDPDFSRRAHDPNVRGASPRKRAQLAAVLEAAAPLAQDARRVVDFGSGHGQLTSLAADAFDLPSLGFERDPRRVDRAGSLARGVGGATFEVVDALASDVVLDPSDLAIGLHACGALGDRLVEVAARGGAAVALVGCCPQKIGVRERIAMSRAAHGIALPKKALGLANLSAGELGVERPLATTLEGRATRQALAVLLRSRGVVVAPGEEMKGLNRRRALGDFGDLARAALAARDLNGPTSDELAASLEAGRAEFEAARRFSLPRNALARSIEVFIALDRAGFLIERGYDAEVVELFTREETPRNIAVLARRGAP